MTVKGFTSPTTGRPADPNVVRGNDNVLAAAVNVLEAYVEQDKSPIASVSTSTVLDGTAVGGTILVDATAGAVTITLPTAAIGDERKYNIKKIDSSAFAVTVDANGAETIDGELTIPLLYQYENLTVQSNGTSWSIL